MATISADDLQKSYESASDLKAGYEGQQKPVSRAEQMARDLQAGKPQPFGLPGIPVAPLGMALPPAAGLISGALQQGAASALEGLLGGNKAPQAATEGLRTGLTGLVLGAPFAAARGVARVREGTSRLAAEESRMAGETALAKGKQAHDTAMTNALNTTEQRAYKAGVQGARDKYAEDLRQARGAYKTGKQATEQAHAARVAEQEAKFGKAAAGHAEKSGAQIADEARKAVPAWKDYPADVKGLTDMVYGTGQQKLSEAFDTAMKDVVTKGKGTMVPVLAEDAKVLGIKNTRTPKFADAGAKRPKVEVDAGELAEAATGFWKKDSNVYRRVVGALDAKGVGDPAARKAYSSGQAFIQYIDKTKALEGGVFRPDRIVKGLTDLKTVDQLRRRSMGNVFEGPMQAARGGPLAPPDIPKPVVPPFIPPPRPSLGQPPLPRVAPQTPMPTPRSPEELGVRTSPLTAPAMGGALGHVAGFGLGELVGHPWMGSMIGGPLGAAAGKAAFPQGLVSAPLPASLRAIMSLPPQQANALIQLYFGGQGR